MVMDISILFSNYTTYVFGSPVVAVLAFMFVLALMGMRFSWSMETYLVVLLPFLLIAGVALGGGVAPLVIVGVGLVIGLGLLALLRR